MDTSPSHRQLAAALRSRIVSGELPVGAKLPAEVRLAADWDVSRPTAREALRTLEAEGLVDVTPGAVRRVRDRSVREVRLTRGADEWAGSVRASGHVPGVSAPAVSDGGAEWRARLGLYSGERVVVREVLRTVDGLPDNLDRAAFPYDPALADPADIPQGSVRLLGELGRGHDRERVAVEPRMPSAAEKRQLGLGGGTPVLVEYRTGYRGGVPAFASETLWKAGTRLVLDLSSDPYADWTVPVPGSHGYGCEK